MGDVGAHWSMLELCWSMSELAITEFRFITHHHNKESSYDNIMARRGSKCICVLSSWYVIISLGLYPCNWHVNQCLDCSCEAINWSLILSFFFKYKNAINNDKTNLSDQKKLLKKLLSRLTFP